MLHFRWLGVGGIELRAGDQILLIDPYLTRLSLWRLAVGRVRPNRDLVAARIPRCDFVLVTHPHVDHLLDVPDVLRNTGALALGSPNTCWLLGALGVPARQIREIDVGDRLTLGDFEIEVLPAGHTTFWGWLPFSGPLSSNLHPPLRARDYRMDRCFGYLVDADGARLLHCPGTGAPAGVLIVKPLETRARYKALLRQARPRVVIPVHWDDFCRPLSEPMRPTLAPSGQAVPPLKRIDLVQFEQMIEQIAPGTQVLIPQMFRAYDLGELASVGPGSAETSS
jgi:L-ascorbate metabolism protein UlaG (beta-lactamase superfamily)